LALRIHVLEEFPKPLDQIDFLKGVSDGDLPAAPVVVDGDGFKGLDVEAFVGAANEELDLFGLEEREGVAAADGEEATLEGLELAGDGGVEQVSGVEADELLAVGICHGADFGVPREGNLFFRVVVVDFGDEV